VIAEVSWRTTDQATTVQELDALLDSITDEVSPQTPQAVNVVCTIGDCLTIVLGATTESYLSYVSSSGNPPYFVSVGEPSAKGIFTFYVDLDHHSEALMRNVIPKAAARQAIREFVSNSTRLPSCVTWEEV